VPPSVEGGPGGVPPPGLLATRSPEGSWCWRGAMPGGQGRMSGTPLPRRCPRRSHSSLTACPGPRRAGHGRWRGGDAPSARAASLASFAALPARPGPTVAKALDPYVIPYVNPTSFPTRRGCVPLASLVERISAGQSPFVGAVSRKNGGLLGPLRGCGAARPQGALRAIDSTACPHSWRTCGPRRLRRQSDADGIATERGCSVAEGVEAASGRSDGLGGMASASSCTSCLATARS
jgi:hypothetical protein